MKIRPVGAALFHADGRTDVTQQIVAFCYFSKAPKISIPTSQRTQTMYIIKTNRLWTLSEIVLVYCEAYETHTNSMWQKQFPEIKVTGTYVLHWLFNGQMTIVGNLLHRKCT